MKISDLALLLKGTLESDQDVDVSGISGIANAKYNDVTFALDESKLALAEQSQTACILTTATIRKSSKPLIRVAHPKLAFLKCYQALYQRAPGPASIHSSAVVDESVKLGIGVQIGPQVTIEDNVILGDHVIIESGSIIKSNCLVGAGCHLHPRVVLYEGTVLRQQVILHAGVVVGSDGFGYVKDRDTIYKFPQLGRVIIEDNVEIGANSTIDRGSLDDTVIGANSKIDNLCHIAHNVRIGRNMIMAAQSGIAGSTVIGQNVTISGQVAVTDNVTVGDGAVIGGKSAVIGHVDANMAVWGVPARPLAQTKRQMAVASWLTKNFSALAKIVKENS